MAHSRRNSSVNILIGGIVVVAVALVGLLVWALIGGRKEADPMVSSNTASDAQRTFQFNVYDGWAVSYADDIIKVTDSDNLLPSYWVKEVPSSELGLIINWNCYRLQDYVDSVARTVAPWDVTITYRSLPCAQNEALPVVARVYVTLNDGRHSVIVFGPLDGVTWLVTYADPSEGEIPPDLVDAMSYSVTTVWRKS